MTHRKDGLQRDLQWEIQILRIILKLLKISFPPEVHLSPLEMHLFFLGDHNRAWQLPHTKPSILKQECLKTGSHNSHLE